MGKIFCLMGKSASGKDTIYRQLLINEKLQLKKIVPYTTRPIRENERDGVQYHFVDEEALNKFEADGKVIEKGTHKKLVDVSRRYKEIMGIART